VHEIGHRDRLSALARTELMDSGAEPAFDRFTRLTSELLGVPVALISLVDDRRQYFKSRVGVELEQTPLQYSFCRHVVAAGVPLVVPDTRQDPRLSDNPAVTQLGVIAYCGVPLTDRDGHTLGSLCAISGEPREWSARDVAVLGELAAGVLTEIELRLAGRALKEERRMLDDSQAAAEVGSWAWNLETGAVVWSDHQFRLHGLEPAEHAPPFGEYLALVHPEDREALAAALDREPEPRPAVAATYRIVRDGEVRTLELRGELLPGADGRAARLAGTTRDVTEERETRAARRAVEHRQSILLSSLPDTMAILYDRELRIVLMQGGLADRGFDAERFVGRRLHELIEPGQMPGIESQLRAALQGQTGSLEYPAGTGRIYSVDVAPYRGEDGSIDGAFTVWRDVTERVEQERDTRLLATIVEQSDDAVIVKDRHANITEWNPGAERLYGYSAAEVIGRPMSILVPFDRAGEERALLRRAMRGETIRQFETVRVRHDGRRIDVSISVSPIRDATGQFVAASVVARDITTRRAQERARREAEERLRVTIEHAPIGVALVELDPLGRGRLLSANETLAELLGEPDPVLSELSLTTLVHRDDADVVRDGLLALAEDKLARVELEVRCLHAAGQLVWLMLAGAAVPGSSPEEPPRQAVFHVMDIGERKRFEGQLQHLADHDPLTGLYNRGRFESELERAVAHSDRYGSYGGVLLIDLDGFKYVNDTMGHSCGDELVTRIGGLLRGVLRETDVVARIGGDEFAVIVNETSEAEALVVAEKILGVLRERAIVLSEDRHAKVTASIGVTTFDGTSSLTPEELMVEADIAMYEAKEAGKNCAAAYRREEQVRGSRITKRDSWLERLRQASANEGFELLAQPIVGICAQDVPHFELLLRLRSEDGDLIPPGTFLYNAERFNLVQGIDRWVFGRALELLRTHHAAGNDISLSVNMSGKTLNDPELLKDLSAMIAACPIPRDRLVVEVTETAAITNIEKAGQVARSLRELGVQFALDDFGAGFASFYYLKHLDFDYLKIDGEFVRSLARNLTDQLVIKSVVDIARGLGAQTIAEFVGDDDAVDRLRELGVDFGQGYHLGRPGPLEERLPALTQGTSTELQGTSPETQLASAELARSSSD
jgi:diguanylate cyclase (GGDEF)-like protein/PAS domain S-box-containing protein